MEEIVTNLAPELYGIPVGTPENITDGMIWLEPIDNILTKCSCDGADPTIDERIRDNGNDDDIEDWEWSFSWRKLLERKRSDYSYTQVKQSLDIYGFVRPVTVDIDSMDQYEYGDGHHRLAAAIDLGYTHIPVEAYHGSYNISDDSGCWDGSIHGARIENPPHNY